MTRTARPAFTLPAGAWGYIARRADRPERLALYDAQGRLNTSFGQDQGIMEIDAILSRHGLLVSEQHATHAVVVVA